MSEHIDEEQHEIAHIDDTIDIISNLPDCILHHILSFMPTKEVVKKSILSTKWKNLWASVPNIDFDDALSYDREVDGWNLPEVTSFEIFVEKILRLRDPVNIEKFRLSCRGFYNASQIHSWISEAIMHNVQELDLYLLVADSSVIPKSMFDSTLLTSLKMELRSVVELPSEISFPCLKTLHLSLLTFPNDESTQKLFSGCPILEELVLLNCGWMNLKNIMISSSTLKSLTIEDAPYYGSCGCEITIDASNLACFDYTGNLSNEILLNDISSSMVKTFIHIPATHERQKEVAFRAVDLLKRLQYVVSLRVSNRTIESLGLADNMMVRFPVFPNLSNFILTTKIGNYAFGALMDIFYLCPILQSICLSQGFEHRMRLSEDDSIWLLVPLCMSNCFKTVTFKNFYGNDSEICFVKCILKYACVLERMDIWWSKSKLPDLKKQTEVTTELETTERTSIACVVKFS